MIVMFRVVISAIVMVAAYYSCYWILPAFLPIPWGIAAVIAYLVALAAGWYTWTRTAAVDASLSRSVGYWALVVGAIGFVGGFFGPMIFVPGANQGPMLGIFITGPAGALIGAIGGFIHWLVRRNRSEPDAAA